MTARVWLLGALVLLLAACVEQSSDKPDSPTHRGGEPPALFTAHRGVLELAIPGGQIEIKGRRIELAPGARTMTVDGEVSIRSRGALALSAKAERATVDLSDQQLALIGDVRATLTVLKLGNNADAH